MKAACVAWILWIAASASAQISPGPLNHSHSGLEGIKNCMRCHSAGKKIEPEKCLSCHSLIRSGMDAGKGLHRKRTHDRCETCHIEHHGRDFDLIYWPGGKKAFNHAATAFPLAGAHRRLDCRACHRAEFIRDTAAVTRGGGAPGRTFHGLSADCAACHEDPHAGQFGRPCGDCHDGNRWKPASRFNHDGTRFALTGRHRGAACGKCHTPVKNTASKKYPETTRYSGTRFGNCDVCHTDPHAGRLGRECGNCHATEGWSRVRSGAFRHEMTGYPLQGRHARLACDRCHVPGKPRKIGRHEKCSDCHADVHAGRFSNRPEYGDCPACHTVEGFSPARFTVSRHAATRFPLTGAHLAVPCVACHAETRTPQGRTAPRFDFPDTGCKSCHSDPHLGRLDRWIQAGGCETCHNDSAWKNIRFDHDRTRFRLEGRHQAAACRACHADSASDGGRAVLRFAGTPTACIRCHRDPHGGQFSEATGGSVVSTRCERCHSPSGWTAEKFDHTRDSNFPLTGGHRGLACGKCHTPVNRSGVSFIRYKPIAHHCDSCHGAQTVESKDGT
jgi:hypothetical protein